MCIREIYDSDLITWNDFKKDCNAKPAGLVSLRHMISAPLVAPAYNLNLLKVAADLVCLLHCRIWSLSSILVVSWSVIYLIATGCTWGFESEYMHEWCCYHQLKVDKPYWICFKQSQ